MNDDLFLIPTLLSSFTNSLPIILSYLLYGNDIDYKEGKFHCNSDVLSKSLWCTFNQHEDCAVYMQLHWLNKCCVNKQNILVLNVIFIVMAGPCTEPEIVEYCYFFIMYIYEGVNLYVIIFQMKGITI